MTPDRLQELLNAFLDDRLDVQDERELAKALETDDGARRAFVRASDQHQALRELLERSGVSPQRRFPWFPIVAAAAAAILGLSIYLLRSDAPTTPNPGIVIHEKKPAPAPRQAAPLPSPQPPPTPEPKPAPTPAPVPPPLPPAPPEKPENVSPPPTPAPKPPEVPPSKPPPAPPARESAVAVATVESVRGDVYRPSEGKRHPVAAGQILTSGQGVGTGGAESGAVLVFPDTTRLELKSGTLLQEISATIGKKVVLVQGVLWAEVARQPAGQPMIFATRHAEATILGTRLAFTCAETTRLELKEGKARFTRLEDRKAVELAAGQYSVAGKGIDLAPKKITRGPMMSGAAIWGEDFHEPEELEKEWSSQRNGILLSTRGNLEFDLSPGGDASLTTRAAFAPPLRITVEVEFTQKLKGSLLALRLQSWKQAKEFIHVDLDDERYYLTSGDQTLTADAPRKNPHRERWTLELTADGGVAFFVDGKQLLKAPRPAAPEEYHVTLMAKAKDAPPGARVRFYNLILERIR